MNENMLDRKLLMTFITGRDSDGKDITTTKTISNIHLDTTHEELRQISEKYVALTNHTHVKTMIVDYYPGPLTELV